MGILHLPLEVMFRVAEELQPEDVFHLGLTSKNLAHLIRSQALCKIVLSAQARFSAEAVCAQKDGDYARGLRALAKRRNAIRAAKPFHVALLGVGTSFIYKDGVLCYVMENGLVRLLDIRRSADHEVVIDVRRMVRHCCPVDIPSFELYKIKLIHYAHGILTCILAIRVHDDGVLQYILVIKPRSARLILAELLNPFRSIHVSNTDEFLFLYAIGPGSAFGFRKAHQLDLKTGEWFPRPRMFIMTEGTPPYVYFEILDGYVYAITDSVVCEDSGQFINSPETGIGRHTNRFPILSSPDGNPEVGMTRGTWVQAYSAAKSDERWTFMRVEKDEATGKIVVFQIRQEWSEHGHNRSRTCIRREMVSWAENRLVTNALMNDPLVGVAYHGNPFHAETSSALSNLQGQQYEDDADGEEDGNLLPPGTRLHHGDNSSTVPHYGAQQCFIRSYFSTTGSFVDLVNDTHRHNGQEQSLRLRVMTESAGGGNETVFWPPAANDTKNSDPRMEEVRRVLNQPGYDGDLEWKVDSRSFVYSMGANAHSTQKVIVYVGFDPTVKLRHLKAFNTRQGRGHPCADVCWDSPAATFPPLAAPWVWLEEPLYFRPREKNGFDFFG
ncbi:uncharacterized protein DNG_00894 [Cephalotrichum gorgonifer]|uniref:F-box domain-containing protein n=1 Tax=Cephalotrichum gorgonifer TaxID=2041049 RepID=A0AAE8MRN0_9PEZI|nr:uncharacterized protein DNG_00894 [Cephalotrichum gorgonifer]